MHMHSTHGSASSLTIHPRKDEIAALLHKVTGSEEMLDDDDRLVVGWMAADGQCSFTLALGMYELHAGWFLISWLDP